MFCIHKTEFKNMLSLAEKQTYVMIILPYVNMKILIITDISVHFESFKLGIFLIIILKVQVFMDRHMMWLYI